MFVKLGSHANRATQPNGQTAEVVPDIKYFTSTILPNGQVADGVKRCTDATQTAFFYNCTKLPGDGTKSISKPNSV